MIADNKIRVETELGTIVAYESTDPDFPGVFVDLQRDGYPHDLSLAIVECNQYEDEPCLQTIVFGSGKTDDYTDKIVHDDVDEWFGVE